MMRVLRDAGDRLRDTAEEQERIENLDSTAWTSQGGVCRKRYRTAE